jgi:hypothetical protein
MHSVCMFDYIHDPCLMYFKLDLFGKVLLLAYHRCDSFC